MIKIYNIEMDGERKNVRCGWLNDFAQAANISPQTVRKWQQKGIFPISTYRTYSGYRLYPVDIFDELITIVKKYALKQGVKVDQESMRLELSRAFEQYGWSYTIK